MRHRSSWRQDLGLLLNPRSIAIIGASDQRGVAADTVASLRDWKYAGSLSAVNPNRSTAFGQTCYATVSALPGPPDLVVVAVKAPLVPAVLNECAEFGVPTAIIMSTGFAEAGPAGAALAHQISEIAQRHRMRICGPGSFGIISVRARVSAYMTSIRGGLRRGGLGVVAQSGSLLNALVQGGVERRLGFSYLVSTGSEAGLTSADFLSFFARDDETRVVVAIIEQIRDVEAFRNGAEQLAEMHKPLVVLKLGRSDTAQKASAAHTGALAGSSDFYDAFFRRHGVRSVQTLDELVETATLLGASARPRGGRVAVVTISGGDCVLASDVAARCGIVLPTLTERTQEGLRQLLPEIVMTANPVDIGTRPLWEAGLLRDALNVTLADPAVDMIATRLPPTPTLFEEIGRVNSDSAKPVIAFTRLTQSLDHQYREISDRIGVPILQEVEKAFKAMKHLSAFAGDDASRRSPSAARRVTSQLEDFSPLRTLAVGPSESKWLLESYGIQMARHRLVATEREAIEAAKELGYPVVLKLVSADVLHKTDIGAVRTGLTSDAQVTSVFKEFALLGLRPSIRADRILVQEMIPSGVEVFVGMSRDPQFGPGLVFGLGGTLVEVIDDAAMRLPPLSHAEASLLIDETKAGKVLAGVRGRRPSDLRALTDTLVRFSELCVDLPEIVEAIEVNPLIVRDDGQGVVAVDARIILIPTAPAAQVSPSPTASRAT